MKREGSASAAVAQAGKAVAWMRVVRREVVRFKQRRGVVVGLRAAQWGVKRASVMTPGCLSGTTAGNTREVSRDAGQAVGQADVSSGGNTGGAVYIRESASPGR